MHYLVATDSVHTTAAACDYLEGHAAPDDEVTVVTVHGAGADDRDGGPDGREEGSDDRDRMDALNVARARLAGFGGLETDRREGDPAAAILAAADESDADVLVIGPHGGHPEVTGVGETARRVLDAADVPVVVVPIAQAD